MAKATDFTPEEWELLCGLPFIVAGTSLAVIHASALKAMKTALSIYAIVRDTSEQFPDNECIQQIFVTRHESHLENNQMIEQHQGSGKEAVIALRNDMIEQVGKILNQKSQPQECKEYKQWLLQIAREVMQKAESHGFLGLDRGRAKIEVARAVQDFAQVLQIAD
ncbi:MAG TPA: hypothetical protein VGF67_31195 [Ktedonobacteraceae bacterium]